MPMSGWSSRNGSNIILKSWLGLNMEFVEKHICTFLEISTSYVCDVLLYYIIPESGRISCTFTLLVSHGIRNKETLKSRKDLKIASAFAVWPWKEEISGSIAYVEVNCSETRRTQPLPSFVHNPRCQEMHTLSLAFPSLWDPAFQVICDFIKWRIYRTTLKYYATMKEVFILN